LEALSAHVLEDDIRNKFTRWMTRSLKRETLSMEAAHDYLNGLLSKKLLDTPDLMGEYGLTLPISRSMALRCIVGSI